MRYILFCLLLIISTNLFAEKIYQWTDEQGNTVFSDKPHPDAKQIDVPKLPSFESKVTPQVKENSTKKSSKKSTNSQVIYQTLHIVSPKQEETIWSNPGVIMVNVDLKPALAKKDKLIVTVDGNKKGETTSGNSIELTGIDRGTHSIQAKIIDANGKVVKTSQSITVYLHKTSVNQPANTQPITINRP